MVSISIEKHLSRVDPVLGRIIKAAGPLALKPDPKTQPFQALVRSVVYQQLTGKAAATILGRVVALYPGKKFPKPEDILATSDETLRSAGLSGSKTRAVKDIAEKTLSGLVPTRAKIAKLSDEDIIAHLTQIRGVGRWTVEMFLIFTLGREDVLPVTDYGVRKGFAVTYKKKELPTPKELERIGEKWKPFRSAAAWYLWRALEL